MSPTIPLVLALAQAALQEEAPPPLATAIVEVTVYPDRAAVRRRAELPPAGGTFRVEGLPGGLDPDSVRVRAEGGEVVAVEMRERIRERAPDPRGDALLAQVREVEAELAALADRDGVLARVARHLEALVRAVPPADPEGAAPDVASWERDLAYLEERIGATRSARRALALERAEAERRLANLRQELGSVAEPAGVRVRDLLVDVFADGGARALEIDYHVPQAGWEPAYDLRASADLASLEVVYRARVRQASGEDWRDVELLLSTAAPSRGARGPDPEPQWVGLHDPRPAARPAAAAEAPRADDYGERRAAVEEEGLSVRFRLPARETIESRPAETTVLVGRFEVPLAVERVCVPSVDPGVWVRGRAANASDYVLLEGRASVHVGGDFLGHGRIETARPGEELSVPLGLEPGVTVERVQLLDRREQEGVFRARRVQREAWRVDLAAHASGAPGERPLEVIVHEVLPRSTSDRIEVELERAVPEPARGERWARMREEEGVLTWVVRVPRGGTARIEHEVSVESPESSHVVRRVVR